MGLRRNPRRMPNNEGRACDAILRVLEAQTGQDRSDISRPEQEGVGPPVELRFRLGNQTYAMEHTQIEAFENQIYFGQNFSDFIEPVTNELSGTLPRPGVYRLCFPVDARLDARPHRMPEIRDQITAWVREQAQRLHERNPERPTRERNPRGFREQVRAQPPGIPYEVVLQREAHWAYSARSEGVLTTARIAPEDVEGQRADRLRRALNTKCPKLHRCKEGGARTVLILEDGDIALSNHVLIGDGLAAVLQERADSPDEIYLVETAVDTWGVRLLKFDDELLPDVDWHDFPSADLADITAPATGQHR